MLSQAKIVMHKIYKNFLRLPELLAGSFCFLESSASVLAKTVCLLDSSGVLHSGLLLLLPGYLVPRGSDSAENAL